jgi:hypothetical protein
MMVYIIHKNMTVAIKVKMTVANKVVMITDIINL